jgi:hypothetical protein
MTPKERQKLVNSLSVASEREARKMLDDVCALCQGAIWTRDWYRDRGKYRRAHSECVRSAAAETKP